MRKYIKKKVETNSSAKFLGVICFVTNVSQLPDLLGNTVVKGIVIASWLILFGYVLYVQKLEISKKLLSFYILLFIFDFILLSFQFFSTNNYISSSFVYPVHLSMFVLTVSYFVGRISNEEDIVYISNLYIYSALIVGIVVYFDSFNGVDWINAMGYLYKSKNSIAQVFLIAITLILLFYKGKFKILKYSMIIFFGLLLFMLQSRASLIGLFLIIGYFMFYVIKGKTKKIIYISCSLIVFLIITMNEQIYDLVVNKVLLNNRASTDLDTISSGRLRHLEIFMANFESHFLFGYGSYYLESFPLAALMSYGIIGAIPLLILSIKPILFAYLNRKDKTNSIIRKLIVILAIIALINSLFEELSPFGPGVKNFMLWLACGLYIGLKSKTRYRGRV